MANWQRTLKLEHISRDADLAAKANGIADALEKLKPFGAKFEEIDEERDEIVQEFRDAARDPELDEDMFDEVMERLYDWADTRLDAQWNGKKVCWINAASLV